MSLLTPPSEFPVWAINDQVDPVSNQNNVVAPPTEKQLFGWARSDFPPRNWFNWLGRLTNNWLQYLSQNDPKCQTICRTNLSYGTAYTIADTQTQGRLLLLYIQDTSFPTGGNAGDRFSGMCVPWSPSSSDRTVYAMGASSNITVSQISNATGQITVSTGGTGTSFTLVVQQFIPS
jgi:hypothetical protein